MNNKDKYAEKRENIYYFLQRSLKAKIISQRFFNQCTEYCLAQINALKQSESSMSAFDVKENKKAFIQEINESVKRVFKEDNTAFDDFDDFFKWIKQLSESITEAENDLNYLEEQIRFVKNKNCGIWASWMFLRASREEYKNNVTRGCVDIAFEYIEELLQFNPS